MGITPSIRNKGQKSCCGSANTKMLLVAAAMLLVQCNPDMPRRPRANAPQGQGPSAAQQQEEQQEQQRQRLEQMRQQLQQQQRSQSTTPAGSQPGVPDPKPSAEDSRPQGNPVELTVAPWFITGEKMGWNLSCAKISAGGQVLGDGPLCNKRAESGCYSLAQEELGKPKPLPSIQSGTKIEVAFDVTRRGLEDCDGPGGTPGFTYDQAQALSVTFGSQSTTGRLKCGRKQVGGKYLHKICLEDSIVTGGPMDFNDLVLVFESDKPLEFSGTTCSDQSIFSPQEAGRCT